VEKAVECYLRSLALLIDAADTGCIHVVVMVAAMHDGLMFLFTNVTVM
jgi:hypothetical protein